MAKKEKENKVKKHFFKDFKAELKKVMWPSPKQLVNNTVAVVSIVLIAAIIVFVLDVAFDSMNKYGISNLQSIVKENFSKEEENPENSNDSNNAEENSENVENNEQENGENNNEENNSNPEENAEQNSPVEEQNQNGEETNPEQ